jgi:hypothetical protein
MNHLYTQKVMHIVKGPHRPKYPMNRRMGGHRGRNGRFREEENFLKILPYCNNQYLNRVVSSSLSALEVGDLPHLVVSHMCPQ